MIIIFIAMNEAKVFSWGANSYGQLGLGMTEDQVLPSRILLDCTQASSLKQISGGGGHTVLLKSDGEILVFGWNKNGQCGVPGPPSAASATPSSSSDLLVPQPLPQQPWRVEKVTCGWNHTLALIAGGQIASWGSNTFGQLGMPSIDKQSVIPTILPGEVFGGDHVIDVSAGLRHSLTVTDGGQLFGWGDGRKGQLGLGGKELLVHRQPKFISIGLLATDGSSKCVRVCCGAHHSTALTSDRSLLLWGLNQHGQCGVSTLTDEPTLQDEGRSFKLDASGRVSNVYVPMKMKGVAALAEVHCGWSHTIVITALERRVFGWGRADYGQLGQRLSQPLSQDSSTGQAGEQDTPVPWTAMPVEIHQLKGVKQIACGSEHTVVITSSGQVAAFGWNEHGMCGTGSTEDVATATEVSGLPCDDKHVLVGAGAGHSMALCNCRTS